SGSWLVWEHALGKLEHISQIRDYDVPLEHFDDLFSKRPLRRWLAVHDECALGRRLEMAQPCHDLALIGMGGQGVQALDSRPDGDFVVLNKDRCFVLEYPAAKGAFRLVAGEDHDRVRIADAVQ